MEIATLLYEIGRVAKFLYGNRRVSCIETECYLLMPDNYGNRRRTSWATSNPLVNKNKLYSKTCGVKILK